VLLTDELDWIDPLKLVRALGRLEVGCLYGIETYARGKDLRREALSV
jgi:hypothetical protein